MLGAIIGDIVGSRFEWNNIKKKRFKLFTRDCFATDDSVMTLAIAKALAENDGKADTRLEKLAVKNMREFGALYPDAGYGGRFAWWLTTDKPKPYNSFGNGSAMRVSACAWAAGSLEEALELARRVTKVSHNHPEGMKGAAATTAAIYMARQGCLRNDIRDYIEEHYYPLDFSLDEIRDTYRFNETCQETVPQAIRAFLESESFEDAIRNAISLGGDSDTLAAITGSIAEAYYGVPDDIREKALSYLDEFQLGILKDFEERFEAGRKNNAGGKFSMLTRYIELIDEKDIGEFRGGRMKDNVIVMPFVVYSETVKNIHKDIYNFCERHPEYNHYRYAETLKSYGIGENGVSMEQIDVSKLDDMCVIAMLMWVVRGERFCDGLLMEFFENGCIKRWLERLAEIDEEE